MVNLMNKIESLLLIIALISAFYCVLFSPFKGALPLPFIIAVTIVASVAPFGIILSLSFEKRNRNFSH